MIDVIVFALLAVGTFFVVVGTVGLVRFPDLPTRLHAVAKADNLGLGFIVAALIVDVSTRPDDGSPLGVALKLVLIWLLALLGTAANSHLLAGHARARELSGAKTPRAPSPTVADSADEGPDAGSPRARPERRRHGAEVDE
ncbi:monovalent cation/H(+) antiporter subunit G [Microbacterium sp. VKM Ac-2923]|uniref:monovalent cation/H(+) antiporter subunit G n=1 Tax=Microbacterium sp. VKM Ac-2923 TaxID=2929476 RepID=UPI001FB488FA|nr:monovalent cation/H(+) antiporter subunit G [Microbacterium sp. VKM Ac-2923]MCJ1708368.1 monovalent cation/H(+) antiporter subunit G [Microbacterium sp. VKM Ac-2923]